MKKIIINSQNNIKLLEQMDILFCKSDNCYTTYHLKNSAQFTVCKSLTRTIEALNPSIFIKISQSYVINMNYIDSIDKKNKIIELTNNDRIPFTIPIGFLISTLTLFLSHPLENIQMVKTND